MLSHCCLNKSNSSRAHVSRKKSCLFNIPWAGHYRSRFMWKIRVSIIVSVFCMYFSVFSVFAKASVKITFRLWIINLYKIKMWTICCVGIRNDWIICPIFSKYMLFAMFCKNSKARQYCFNIHIIGLFSRHRMLIVYGTTQNNSIAKRLLTYK